MNASGTGAHAVGLRDRLTTERRVELATQVERSPSSSAKRAANVSSGRGGSRSGVLRDRVRDPPDLLGEAPKPLTAERDIPPEPRFAGLVCTQAIEPAHVFMPTMASRRAVSRWLARRIGLCPSLTAAIFLALPAAAFGQLEEPLVRKTLCAKKGTGVLRVVTGDAWRVPVQRASSHPEGATHRRGRRRRYRAGGHPPSAAPGYRSPVSVPPSLLGQQGL